MSVAGNWKLTMQTPFGEQTPTLKISDQGGYSGTLESPAGAAELEELKVEGNNLSFTAKVQTPMGKFPVSFRASVEGDALEGTFKTMLGVTEFTGVRI